MSHQRHVLLLEDERGAANDVRRAFESDGARVTLASSDTAVVAAQSAAYDLTVVICVASHGGAIDAVRALRAWNASMPIIVVAAVSGDDDIARWLDAGADDCVASPTSPTRLFAHARAQMRRVARVAADVLRYADITLDRSTYRVVGPLGDVLLTAKEFALLECLMRQPGEVVTRARLLEQIWGYQFDPGTNVAEVALSRLRQKLADVTRRVSLRTVRRVGVLLEARDGA